MDPYSSGPRRVPNARQPQGYPNQWQPDDWQMQEDTEPYEPRRSPQNARAYDAPSGRAAYDRSAYDNQQQIPEAPRQPADQWQTRDPRRPSDRNSRPLQDPPRPAVDSRRPSHDTWQPYSTVPAAFAVPIQRDPSGSDMDTFAPREEPRGVDLSGKVRILSTPGQKYLWSIGSGGFTDVFKGEYRKMPDARATTVAIKIFRLSTSDGQQQRDNVNRRLIRESAVWLRLKHRNIQPYLGHCSDLSQCVALVSPFCGNSTIMKYVTKNPSSDRRQLVQDIAEGLQYLHSQNVIHGDLQCNNVLVDDSGYAVLTDFGRAKVIGAVGFSTPMLAGCAAYMAPELFPANDVNIDELFSKKSDVYAFGMLCFEIFTNEEPFASYKVRLDWQIVPLIQHGKRPKCTPQVQRLMTEDIWMLMEACWVPMPDKRPSADQIVQRLKH